MKILTFTTLYPNSRRFHHGIFVHHRVARLRDVPGVQLKVVAPVPWFPWRHRSFGRYGVFAGVPKMEVMDGLEVYHPRYYTLPRVMVPVAPLLLAVAMLPVLRGLIRQGFDFEVIDAHYGYPDGVAAVLLGGWLHKPVVVTARGSDLNELPQYRIPRRWMTWALPRAAGLVTVCEALQAPLVAMGVTADRITVLRNGVDLDRFRPEARESARRALNLEGPTLLSVGHLIERKGHHRLIEALPALPGVKVLIIGEGEERGRLQHLARRLGVADRLSLLGAVPQEQLPRYYSAADALVLASSREGWANVLLESMACGTPVIATRVWGTPEVVSSPDAGVLMADPTPQALVSAYHRLMANPPAPSATRRFAEQFGWESTTQGQMALFQQVVCGRKNRHPGA